MFVQNDQLCNVKVIHGRDIVVLHDLLIMINLIELKNFFTKVLVFLYRAFCSCFEINV